MGLGGIEEEKERGRGRERTADEPMLCKYFKTMHS